MFSVVSENITRKLEDNLTIKSEDREIYRYGIQQGLTIILNLITTLVIGLICGMVWQSVVFMVFYIPLRSFAGGYHEKTPERCYVFSIVLMFAILLAMRFASFTELICSIILLVSSVSIVLLAPVEDRNKPLDELEQKVYRKRALLIWASELIVAFVCMLFGQMHLAICLTMTMVVMAIMLSLGQLKNMWHQFHKEA